MSKQIVISAQIGGFHNYSNFVLTEGEFEDPASGEVRQVSSSTPVVIDNVAYDCIATSVSTGRKRLGVRAVLEARDLSQTQ